VAYSVTGVIENELVDLDNPHPILIGNVTKVFKNFVDENIIFLQPTRIVSRKRIEVGFKLVKELFESKRFLNKFYESPNLKLTILVTGPIPPGQSGYFIKLISRFKELLDSFPEEKASRIHLGFMFSEFDKKAWIRFLRKRLRVSTLVLCLASLIKRLLKRSFNFLLVFLSYIISHL